jgi:hypothetical protein
MGTMMTFTKSSFLNGRRFSGFPIPASRDLKLGCVALSLRAGPAELQTDPSDDIEFPQWYFTADFLCLQMAQGTGVPGNTEIPRLSGAVHQLQSHDASSFFNDGLTEYLLKAL